MISVDEARRIAEARSIPEPNTGCWLWLGAVTDRSSKRGQYPIVGRGGKRFLLTRALLGLTDPSIEACHHCDTPLCVNEDHLFAGTHTDNIRDCVRKGRARNGRGSKTHCKRGHPFSAENTRESTTRYGGMVRQCRECCRMRCNRAARNRRRKIGYKRAFKHPRLIPSG